MYASFQDIFNSFNAQARISHFKLPYGQAFIIIFSVVSVYLVMTFLESIYTNHYIRLYNNINFMKRSNIIIQKNSSSFDRVIGAITITFFPINFILPPFIIPLLTMKSRRLNDIILKFQYTLLVILYLITSLFVLIACFPVVYAKTVINSGYLAFFSQRKKDKHREKIWLFLISLVLCAPILMWSMIVDLLSLPAYLMEDEKQFKYKYRNLMHDFE